MGLVTRFWQVLPKDMQPHYFPWLWQFGRRTKTYQMDIRRGIGGWNGRLANPLAKRND